MIDQPKIDEIISSDLLDDLGLLLQGCDEFWVVWSKEAEELNEELYDLQQAILQASNARVGVGWGWGSPVGTS